MEEIKTISLKKIRKTDHPDYYKEYYAKNKEKYQERGLARKKIFIYCEICNCEMVKKGQARHKRTPKHLNNILLKNI
jgi:hypothetical protein